MDTGPLSSLDACSGHIGTVLDRPAVSRSTITVWSDSPYTGVAEGDVFFVTGVRLCLREELDFADQLITSYGYEVYRGDERLYWYDDFPHPNDAPLAALRLGGGGGLLTLGSVARRTPCASSRSTWTS